MQLALIQAYVNRICRRSSRCMGVVSSVKWLEYEGSEPPRWRYKRLKIPPHDPRTLRF